MNKGFTLLEVMISIVIFSMILGMVLYLGYNISNYNFFLSENISSQNEVQLTLSMLVIELRSMGPSNVGSYPIELSTPTSLTFYSDIDQDGLFERVRYYLNGNILMKGITKPSGSPLAYNFATEKTTESVHGLILGSPAIVFSYYPKKSIASDPPMAQPVNPSLIRAIKAEVTADNTPNIEPGPVTFSIFATIRNLRMTQ